MKSHISKHLQSECSNVSALWPGFSRSGSTISGGLLARVSHTAAAEYTFILAVPMMVAASGLDLIKSWIY